ncbi:non-ribosomal peptide synthetase, partial [Duganella violaceipulchra]
QCRVSQLTAPTFDAFLRDLFVPLCAGGTLCLPPARKLPLDQMLEWLGSSGVTLVHCVPSLLRALLSFDQLQAADVARLAALRTICLSGEVLLPATVRQFREVFGDGVELVNFYGASETTMIRCHHRIVAADVERGYIPIGKPIAATQMIVLDADGVACPVGTPGEIYVRSAFFTLGYYRDAALSAQVFVPNPLRPGADEVVYRSGDMGVLLADGNLRFLGRRDGQVKVNGVRIEVGEIENALLSHPEIAEAAVVARSAEDGSTSLHAYVVARGELPPDLRQFLAVRMVQAALPHSIAGLDALPMTSSGKVDRKALGARKDVDAPSTTAYAAPVTATQEALAGLYAEVLGRERVGIHDDFFALGGHSLRALMVLARIRKAFNVELVLRMLFETPTVAGLAAQIDTIQAAQGDEGQLDLDDLLAGALDELADITKTEG